MEGKNLTIIMEYRCVIIIVCREKYKKNNTTEVKELDFR